MKCRAMFSAAMAVAGSAAAGSIEVDDSQFMQTGVAVAKVCAVFENAAPETPVVWQVAGVENSGPVASGFETSAAGLSWDGAVPGSTDAPGEKKAELDSNGRSCVTITDIVGQRRVTVTAKAAGESRKMVFSIGNGPLSRFMRPQKEKLTRKNLVQVCGEMRVPKVRQLQTVAMKGRYNKEECAMGAAISAGWDTSERWWGEPFVIPGRSRYLNLVTGSPHGTGGASMGELLNGVCLKP